MLVAWITGRSYWGRGTHIQLQGGTAVSNLQGDLTLGEGEGGKTLRDF